MNAVRGLPTETTIKVKKDTVFDCVNGKSVNEDEQSKDLDSDSDLNGLQLNWKGKWSPGKRGRPPKVFSHQKEDDYDNVNSTVKSYTSHSIENEKTTKSDEVKHHKITNGMEEETIIKEPFEEVEHPNDSKSKNERNCGRVNRLQLKKTLRNKNTSTDEKLETEVPKNLSNSQVNGEENCNEISKKNSLFVKQSRVLFGSVIETPYRSRYGRLHKTSFSPDMEFVPLIRKRSTPLKKSHMKSVSETKLEAHLSTSTDQLATSPKNIPIKQRSDVDVSILSTSSEMNSTSELTDGNTTTTACTETQVLESPPTKRSKLTLVDENDIPCEWLVGDLLWSKIAGHPWWPSMVSFDPILGIYSKIFHGGSRIKSQRIYHVQYFGREAERSWTVPNGCLQFEGQAKFDEYVEKMLQSAPSKGSVRQKLVAKYKVKPTRKEAWLLAVEEAEDALKMTRTERKQQLTFEYTNLKKSASKKDSSSASLRTKRISDVKSPCGNGEVKAKRQKLLTFGSPKIDNEVQNNKQSKLVTIPRRKKCKGQFMVFLHKHLPQARLQHPDFSEEALEEYLHLHWDRMSELQRARYTSRLAVDEVKDESYEKKGRTNSSVNEQSSPPHSPEKELVKEEIVNDNSNETAGIEESNSTNIEVQVLSHENCEKKGRTKSPVKEQNSPPHSPEKELVKEEIVNDNSNETAGIEEPKSTNIEVQVLSQENYEKKGRTKSPVKEQNSPPHAPEKEMVKEEIVYDNSNEAAGLEEPKSTNIEVQDVEQSDHSPSDSSSMQDPLDSDFSMSVPTRSEQACQLCEKTDDIIVCKGPCKQAFHPDCLGLTQLPSNFQCDECTTGKHICFACKQIDGVTRKCNIPFCGKFYHEECVKNFPLTARIEGRNMMCPLHACLACLADNPKQSRQKSRLVRCIRCPTAYHPGDGCISAGSVFISPNQIVCANHFEPKKGKQYQSRVNASWCFICSIGGSLICCESCPAAFHIECLEIQQPEGSYYCEDCEVGKHPRYGDIIWVKLGCYRWWPAKICHPKSVPQNIQNMSHDVGDFPVEFFGSHDYYWTHRGRVFLFQDGDKGSKEHSMNRNLAKVFQRAVDEASEAFQIRQNAKHAKELHDNERRCKPPFYKPIKFNKPVGKAQIPPVDLSRINRCECDPTSDNPCGIDSDCLNRMTMFECHPSVCPAGERCQNQKFQKRECAPSVPFRTESRGWGLKALVDIKKGQFVNEYIGELIDEEECERRLQQMHEDNDENFYFLILDKERIIDAGPKGNQARFMNHSCLPNCETQKWTVNGDTRVGLFAISDIPAGTELTFNYNLECRGSEKTKCCCGASICSGYIGIRPKTISAASQEKKVREAATRKKKKRSQVRKHEDECFRCGEGGELVMCDRKSCPKSYHLNCLALTKPPYGRWECPWHHCDDCGKPSTVMCSECPNSFCKDHYMQEKIQHQDGRLLCSDHADDNSEVSEDESDLNESESKDDSKEIAFLCTNLVRDAAKSNLRLSQMKQNGDGPINGDSQPKL